MSKQERRSGEDRRSTTRYPIDIPAEFEVAGVREPGAISDVSFEGCFVLSSGNVEDGSAVKIYLPLADGMKVLFTGVIANHVIEIGFGVRFDSLSFEQREVLVNIVRESRQG